MIRQLNLFGFDETEVLSALGIDSSLFDRPTNKVDDRIIGQSIEYIASKRPYIRIGLKMGFTFPVSIMGVILNVYQNCRTLRDVFDKSPLYAPAVNTICLFSNHSDERYFYHLMKVADGFSESYPIAARHIYDSQYGIILQLMYVLTGKRIVPAFVSSPYEQEVDLDTLETLIQCPVKYKEPFVMAFHKEVVNTTIINANVEMLSIAEKLISELPDTKQRRTLASIVRSYMLQSIPQIDLSLKSVARDLNMSDRTLQRKLFAENTSYQVILDGVRKELANKYLEEDISLVEISFLLGFESQSAFNKFFKRHFGKQPTKYRERQ